MKNIPVSTVEEIKTITLCEASLNRPMRIKALNAEPAVCQRLREMGFCEFAEIRKVSHGSALICHVCGVKVALSRYLAQNIVVETIASSPCSSVAGSSIRD